MKKNVLLFIFLCAYIITTAQINLIKQWDYRYGGSDQDIPNRFFELPDSGFLIVGSSQSPPSFEKTSTSRGGYDYWVMRTDKDGIKIWDKSYGGQANDNLTSAIMIPGSGFLLVGISNSGIGGEKTEANKDTTNASLDFWVVRIDTGGNVLWDKTIGGNSFDYSTDVTMTHDGGFLIVGHTFSDSTADMSRHNLGLFDCWATKLDSMGNLLWEKNYGGPKIDRFRKVIELDDNGFLIGGESSSPAGAAKMSMPCDTTNGDVWIVKIDSVGNQQWDKSFGGTGIELFYDFLQLTNNRILVSLASASSAGCNKTLTNHGPVGKFDFWILTMDESGNVLRENVYGGDSDEEDIGTVSISSNGILVSATSYSSTSGDKSEDNVLAIEQGWIYEIDTLGNKLWDKTIHNNNHNELCYGFQLSDGCYAFMLPIAGNGGEVSQSRMTGYDFWLVKYCNQMVPPVANFAASTQHLCQNTCQDFTNLSLDATSYIWLFPGANPSSDTSSSPQNICYTNTGIYDVSLIAINANGADTLTFSSYIEVYPAVPFSPITQSGDTLFSIPGFTSYQWFYNHAMIPFANDSVYIATQAGNYSVVVTDSNGCQAVAELLNVIAAIESNVSDDFLINPASDRVTITNKKGIHEIKIFLHDSTGRLLFKDRLTSMKDIEVITFPGQLNSGVYFLTVESNYGKLMNRFFVN